ncbi:MAG TPA: hypothetical protein VLF61_02415 [Rhabdochlamydiaceae bacterium]|nr:hypothetical protein [Rhabdochlamydiaceae bacterium]
MAVLAVPNRLVAQFDQKLNEIAERGISWIRDEKNELGRNAGRQIGLAFVVVLFAVIAFISIVGIPLLVKSIKEYDRQVAAFQEKIAISKAKVKDLTIANDTLKNKIEKLEEKVGSITKALSSAGKGKFRPEVADILKINLPEKPSRFSEFFRNKKFAFPKVPK